LLRRLELVGRELLGRLLQPVGGQGLFHRLLVDEEGLGEREAEDDGAGADDADDDDDDEPGEAGSGGSAPGGDDDPYEG
jgi:hypothetical protein